MNLTDDELIHELATRFARSRKAFTDLSVVNRKLVEMNQRLEQSESLKSNFLSNIRNEINNPLNSIIGLAGQLVSLGHDNDVGRLASMIYSEANGLDFQLRNIFMAAELEAGEVDPHLIRANVPAIAEDVAESFRHAAEGKSLTISVELSDADTLSAFFTDAEKVQIIISNLVANAVEFSNNGGSITISLAASPDGGLAIGVRDQGIGISENDQKLIFDRFRQLEIGTTRSHLGHGLGLSITKALIDLLQGSIHVESTSGQGALFTVTLPPHSASEDEDSFAESGNLFIFNEMSEK